MRNVNKGIVKLSVMFLSMGLLAFIMPKDASACAVIEPGEEVKTLYDVCVQDLYQPEEVNKDSFWGFGGSFIGWENYVNAPFEFKLASKMTDYSYSGPLVLSEYGEFFESNLSIPETGLYAITFWYGDTQIINCDDFSNLISVKDTNIDYAELELTADYVTVGDVFEVSGAIHGDLFDRSNMGEVIVSFASKMTGESYWYSPSLIIENEFTMTVDDLPVGSYVVKVWYQGSLLTGKDGEMLNRYIQVEDYIYPEYYGEILPVEDIKYPGYYGDEIVYESCADSWECPLPGVDVIENSYLENDLEGDQRIAFEYIMELIARILESIFKAYGK